jgi:hypothetical protein
MKNLLRAGGIVVGVVVAIFAVIIAAAIYTGKLSRPILWQFPPGYRGWVVVEYSNPGCAPLAKQGIYLVTSISASGRGCTSVPIPEGWRYVRYEYVNADGERTKLRADGWNTGSLIWPISVSREKREGYLFVGTQDELNRSWGSRPD